jgi:hypothetical protein
MNRKQIQTLQAVFREPVRSNLLWADIESLLITLGAEVTEGNGSRVRNYLNGIHAVFHRPHPEKEIDKGALKSLRRFLIEVGVWTEKDSE